MARGEVACGDAGRQHGLVSPAHPPAGHHNARFIGPCIICRLVTRKKLQLERLTPGSANCSNLIDGPTDKEARKGSQPHPFPFFGQQWERSPVRPRSNKSLA